METIRSSPAVGLEGLIPLPARAEKPRSTGVTHVVDPGLTNVEAAGLMEVAAAHVDVVRLGWGSAMVTQALEAKLAIYLENDVAPMLGGTLPARPRPSCGSGRRARRWTPAHIRSSARAACRAMPGSTGPTVRSATS